MKGKRNHTRTRWWRWTPTHTPTLTLSLLSHLTMSHFTSRRCVILFTSHTQSHPAVHSSFLLYYIILLYHCTLYIPSHTSTPTPPATTNTNHVRQNGIHHSVPSLEDHSHWLDMNTCSTSSVTVCIGSLTSTIGLRPNRSKTWFKK